MVSMTMNFQSERPADDESDIHGGDPEWVADLFDTIRDGDLEVALAGFESILRPMRKAAKARRVLATLQPSLICQGLEVRSSRRGSHL